MKSFGLRRHVPRGEHADREQERGQHDQQQADAVDADLVARPERADPLVLLDELEAGVATCRTARAPRARVPKPPTRHRERPPPDRRVWRALGTSASTAAPASGSHSVQESSAHQRVLPTRSPTSTTVPASTPSAYVRTRPVCTLRTVPESRVMPRPTLFDDAVDPFRVDDERERHGDELADAGEQELVERVDVEAVPRRPPGQPGALAAPLPVERAEVHEPGHADAGKACRRSRSPRAPAATAPTPSPRGAGGSGSIRRVVAASSEPPRCAAASAPGTAGSGRRAGSARASHRPARARRARRAGTPSTGGDSCGCWCDSRRLFPKNVRKISRDM